MVLKWREREHKEVDATVERDPGAQMALKMCGLYKFWALKGKRAQVRLLQLLVNYWALDTETFNLDGQPLRIEVEDIYFLTRLSHRGEVVNLEAWGVGSGLNIEDYIATHCIVWTEKVGRELPIRAINNLSLKIVVLVLTQIIGSTSLHQASRPLMLYSLDFLRPTIYDWFTSLMANMKSQLTDCKLDRKRNFGFTYILCSFFFEWVPRLGPRVAIVPHGPHDPTMAWWTKVMRCQGMVGCQHPTMMIFSFGGVGR
jgi:hypothetical protein